MSGRVPGRKTEETGHAYVRDRLSDYLDGQLLGQELQAVEEHLAACGSCRWELQTLRQTVLWTRNLPSMPVPRSFALPIPATIPARAARPRWRLVPGFQLATALVALLLFFAVAGDLALTGIRPASMPAPEVVQQEAAAPAPVEVEVTRVVEVQATVVVEAPVAEEGALLQAAPAEPAAETAMEKAAEPAGARALPTEGALAEEAPMAAAAAPEVTATPDLAATMTAAPPGMGAGAEFEPTPFPPTEEPAATAYAAPETVSDIPPEAPGVGGEVPVTPEATEAVSEAEATTVMEMMALAEPSATPTPRPTVLSVAPAPLATPTPSLAPDEEDALVGPTAQVRVEEPVQALAAGEPSDEEEPERAAQRATAGGALQARATDWLRLVQYGLAALLVLLVGTTAALMIWRRRSG